MQMLNFAKRNFKELIRDPLSLVFEIILPLFLLFIFKQFNLPDANYRLENFTPGIIIFGLAFITLFTAALVAKDKDSSLLIRLAVSPMKASDYILGYIFSLIPLVLIQNVLFFLAAAFLGLTVSINILYTILISILVSILFIAFGILIGSLVSEKAAGGVGSIIVQLVAFTSGMYFSKDLVGKFFARLCELLPFESALNIIRGFLNADLEIITLRNIIVFVVYTILVLILAVIFFKKRMISDNK